MSCNDTDERSIYPAINKNEAAKEKTRIFQQLTDDSVDMIIMNFRITGKEAENQVRQGTKGLRLNLWSKFFLDSLNKKTRTEILKRRKDIEAIYNNSF